jgi:hypothetical protein
VPPLRGSTYLLSRTPGFQSPLSRALPPWAFLCRAFSAPVMRLSLTRMPAGAFIGVTPFLGSISEAFIGVTPFLGSISEAIIGVTRFSGAFIGVTPLLWGHA